MSVVTTLVVVAPDGWPPEQVARLGRAMYAVHEMERRGRLVPSDDGYEPIPMKINGRYVPDGGKIPGGTLWWLGLNYLNLDHLLEELEKVEEFHGVWVWADAEYDDAPTTHLVGRQSPE